MKAFPIIGDHLGHNIFLGKFWEVNISQDPTIVFFGGGGGFRFSCVPTLRKFGYVDRSKLNLIKSSVFLSVIIIYTGNGLSCVKEEWLTYTKLAVF